MQQLSSTPNSNLSSQLRRAFMAGLIMAAVVMTVLCEATVAEAQSIGKLDLMAGSYNLTAKSGNGEVSLSKFGIYKVGFRRKFFSRFEFGAGYTLFTSQVITGDMGYGPDVSLFFYPITEPSAMEYKDDKIEMHLSEQWRPFASMSFHQRSFQSINASYAGFSGGLGTEYSWSKDFDLRGELRILKLDGPDKSTANQMDILLGITFPL